MLTVMSRVQAKKGCADLMFLEVLFWKNTRDAESLRNNYQWKARSWPFYQCITPVSCRVSLPPNKHLTCQRFS